VKFFRVALHGAKFEELDGKEFIYRRSSLTAVPTLMIIQTQLKEIFANKVGGDMASVVVLPNAEVDRSKLDPVKVYIQLASVAPYFSPAESANRTTVNDRNFNVHEFIFEAAYTSGPKAQTDDLSKQQKRKVIFTTDGSFPSIRTRLEIIKKRELIISPIENAIELIEDRVAKLRLELQTNPPRLNSLHQVIQGSVVPMVNAGPLHVCEVFLGANAANYPEHHVRTLRTGMEDLNKLCGFSIALSKARIKPEHLPFQQMVEKHYAVLKKKIKEYTEQPRK
jgi:hypothetical protein